MHIVRFLTFDTAMRVLSAYSTFALQSSQYFIHLGFEQGDGAVGDRYENQAVFAETRRHFELSIASLISCWTLLENNQFSMRDWDIFKDRTNGVAIVSDVESVRGLLNDLAGGLLLPKEQESRDQNEVPRDRYHWYFKEGKVVYYGAQMPEEFETMDTWKWKREEYQYQREYRFAFLASVPMMHVDCVVFRVDDPKRYIQEIHFGPDVSKADKHKLCAGAIAANVVNKIQNFDSIYK